MKAEGGRMKGRQSASTSSFILPPSSLPLLAISNEASIIGLKFPST